MRRQVMADYTLCCFETQFSTSRSEWTDTIQSCASTSKIVYVEFNLCRKSLLYNKHCRHHHLGDKVSNCEQYQIGWRAGRFSVGGDGRWNEKSKTKEKRRKLENYIIFCPLSGQLFWMVRCCSWCWQDEEQRRFNEWNWIDLLKINCFTTICVKDG